jgi:hypothetical protein
MNSLRIRYSKRTSLPFSTPVVGLLLSLFTFYSCATYYQSNATFNREFESGDLERALSTLQTKEHSRKNEFLNEVNNGLVLSMMGRYEESNAYFEKAFLFGEDYRKNYLYEAASYLANPAFTPYRGEDHEHLIVLYYKAMNFLKMKKTEEALVECRRLNIRLQQLSDRYDSENKYREDAFIHNLMGIIYDYDKDYNNAFIAYRNAYTIYVNDYSKLFGVQPPDQLKKDLLRTAWLSGFSDELARYKTELGMEEYTYQPNDGGELVFFWHNGLSPIKAEWGINFIISRSNSVITFTNTDLGLSFPFQVESEKDRNGLTGLELFRVAFPKYIERPVHFNTAEIKYDGGSLPLQVVEDINNVAFKVLAERMTVEMSKALVRAALKKVTEYEVKKSDKTLGSVLGVLNAITEKADTRNWQTLPHRIYYSRVPLKEGANTMQFVLHPNEGGDAIHSFTFQGKKGEMLFHTFTSLESGYPNYSSFYNPR